MLCTGVVLSCHGFINSACFVSVNICDTKCSLAVILLLSSIADEFVLVLGSVTALRSYSLYHIFFIVVDVDTPKSDTFLKTH